VKKKQSDSDKKGEKTEKKTVKSRRDSDSEDKVKKGEKTEKKICEEAKRFRLRRQS